MKETAKEDASKVVVLTKEIKGLAYEETGVLVKSTMVVKREKAGSETAILEATTSEAAEMRGNNSIHATSDNAIDLTSTSTNSDDIPLTRVFKNLQKNLTPSLLENTKFSWKIRTQLLSEFGSSPFIIINQN